MFYPRWLYWDKDTYKFIKDKDEYKKLKKEGWVENRGEADKKAKIRKKKKKVR